MNDATSARNAINTAQLCSLSTASRPFLFACTLSSLIKQQQTSFKILREKTPLALPWLDIPFVGNRSFSLFFALFQTVP